MTFKKIMLITLALCCFPAFAKHTHGTQINKVVALVNNDVITSSELSNEIAKVKKQIEHSQSAMPHYKELREGVLQHMISEKLELEQATRAGIKITDAQLNQAIKNIAARNHVKRSELRHVVTEQGLNYDSYIKHLRDEIQLSQIRQKATANDVHVAENELDDYLNKNQKQTQDQYHLKNILVPISDSATAPEIQKVKQIAEKLLVQIHAGANFDRLSQKYKGSAALEGGDLGWHTVNDLPDVFHDAVTTMKKNDIKGPFQAANGFHIIKLIGVRNSAEKHFQMLTHVRHILIKTNAVTTNKKVQAQLLKIRKRLNKGENFEVLAKQYSQDTHTKIKGGDLGWVEPKDLTPKFAHTMQRLKPHQISRPIHSQFGWHLIEVLARKKIDNTKELIRAQARQALYQVKFQEAVKTWQEKLRKNAYIQIV